MKNPGRSTLTWWVCLGVGMVAFFVHPDSPNISFLLAFLTAAGGFTSWRAAKEDDYTLGRKKIDPEFLEGTYRP